MGNVWAIFVFFFCLEVLGGFWGFGEFVGWSLVGKFYESFLRKLIFFGVFFFGGKREFS